MQCYAVIADQVLDGLANQVSTKQAVVVEGPRIAAVCPTAELPPNLERREFPGCTVLPGLMDAHVHYSAALGPAFLAAGVTTIRDVGNDLDWILERRARHAADVTLGPAIVCCGYLLDGNPPIWQHMGRPHADAAAIQASVRMEVERGVDAIKLYAGLNLELLTAGIEESRRHGKYVLAHLGPVTAEEAVHAGLNCIEHLTGCGAAWKASDESELDALADLLLQHDVAVDPTMVVWDRLGRHLDLAFRFDSRREWMHPCHLAVWNEWRSAVASRLRYQEAMAHLKRALLHLQQRGVTIALGTDTPFPHLIPGTSVHDELAMYVDAGIAPVDALRSATSINARVLGIESRTGSLKPGLNADLLIVTGNPLQQIEAISNTVCTIREGHSFTPHVLSQEMRKSYSKAPEDPITADLLQRMEVFKSER